LEKLPPVIESMTPSAQVMPVTLFDITVFVMVTCV